MLKIHVHVDFQLRRFFYEKSPAEAMETTASVPSKAFNGGGMPP